MNIKILLFALVGIVAVQFTFATAPAVGQKKEYMPTYLGKTEAANKLAYEHRHFYMDYLSFKKMGVEDGALRDKIDHLKLVESHLYNIKDEIGKPAALLLMIPYKLWYRLEYKDETITKKARNRWKSGRLLCCPFEAKLMCTCVVGLDKHGLYFENHHPIRTKIPRHDNSSAPMDTGSGKEERGTWID